VVVLSWLHSSLGVCDRDAAYGVVFRAPFPAPRLSKACSDRRWCHLTRSDVLSIDVNAGHGFRLAV